MKPFILLFQVLQIVFVSTPSLIYMGHAMHRVRREEKRRSREEGGGEGRGGEEDPGGGGRGNDSGEEDEKGGREVEKHGEKEGGGRLRLRGALLQTYVLSILIRSVMEVCPAVKEQLCCSPKVWLPPDEMIAAPPQVVFLTLQYFMYGIFLNPLYVCKVKTESSSLSSVKHSSVLTLSPTSLCCRPGRALILWTVMSPGQQRKMSLLCSCWPFPAFLWSSACWSCNTWRGGTAVGRTAKWALSFKDANLICAGCVR